MQYKLFFKNRFLSGLLVVFGVLTLAVLIAVPVILPVFNFPQPSGPYGIGTVTYKWTDARRLELFGTDRNAHRELIVQIWYPTKKDTSAVSAPYIQNADAVATAETRLHHWPDFTLRSLRHVTTHASSSALMANDKPTYPVLIFLEGLTGYRQMNTFQVEELVSNGYIVVGIDQPGVAAVVVFPDGHQVAGLSKAEMDPFIQQSVSPVDGAPVLNGQTFKDGIISYLAQDVSFTVDQLASVNISDPNNILTEKMDPQQIGILGVSSGGIVGAESCLKDQRLKACLIMDAVMTADVVRGGLQQPSMWITRPAGTMRLEREKSGGWTEKDIEQTLSTERAVYDSLPGNGYFIQVQGMFHIDLTDLDLLSPFLPAVGLSGPIGAERAHEIVNAYSVAFFDKYLKGESESLLDGQTKKFTEVIFEASPVDSSPETIALSGTYVCLPYLDKSKATGEECVFGLKTDEGTYYMVNFGASAHVMEEFQDRKHITAKGFLVLKETLNTDHWAPYNMRGIFTITERQ